MSRFDFRVWDKTFLKMRYVSSISFHPKSLGGGISDITSSSRMMTCSDSILMQSTGRLDKNDKEIFKGDILIGPSDTATILGIYAKRNKRSLCLFEVAWSDDWFGSFYLKNYGGMERTYPTPKDCEIIGNIHENPELLQVSNPARPEQRS